jgi:predicted house-cleaning noncanonical NTP pyrophosphatase (MazG superfamily)
MTTTRTLSSPSPRYLTTLHLEEDVKEYLQRRKLETGQPMGSLVNSIVRAHAAAEIKSMRSRPSQKKAAA